MGWHSDNEPLFGECRETKLIVSVSFGTHALFKWKGKSCPSNEGNSCWLGHGDVLVMGGPCQNSFLHCTDPGSDQERINVTFRWMKQRVPSCPLLKDRSGMLFANVCAGGFSVPGTELVHLGGTSFCQLCQLSPLCVQGLGFKDVPHAGHALWAEVGGGIVFVTSGEVCWPVQKYCLSNS